MSGSGGNDDSPRPSPRAPGSGGRGKGGRGGAECDPCNLVERTALNSPVMAVLSRFRPGMILDVELDTGPPPRLVAKDSGQTAGAITSRSMAQIILCIQGGRSYEAEVLSVNGGLCVVEVRSK